MVEFLLLLLLVGCLLWKVMPQMEKHRGGINYFSLFGFDLGPEKLMHTN